MGEVFLARDTRLGRLVAIKFLTRVSSQNAARFLVEARATAQLSHENIVIIHDLGEHGGTPYMVLEYLKGQTLRQWLDDRRNRWSEEERRGRASDPELAPPRLVPSHAVEIILPVVRALVCAHENGVVHRDLKPSNVMLTDTGAVKVLDFSIAKMLGEPEQDGAGDGDGAAAIDPEELTKTGALLGTGPYMSPEQWGAGSVDHRSDIWAVGILLAELVLGRHPLAPLLITALRAIPDLDTRMPSLREDRPDLGKLASIIDRCLIPRRDSNGRRA
jgi:serine/threonine protein kinase